MQVFQEVSLGLLIIAGGYDAIFCITIGDDPLNRLKDLWTSMPGRSITALTSGVSDMGIKIAAQ